VVGGQCGLIAVIAMLGWAVLTPSSAAGAVASQSFTVAGEHQFVAPAGVTSVEVTLAGGDGGAGFDSGALSGRLGATVSATLAVAPGETLFAEVAGNGQTGLPESTAAGGYGGGGPGAPGSTGLAGGSSGGGASDVRTCSVTVPNPADPAICPTSTTLASRLVVAGGGGAGGDEGDGTAVGGQGGDGDGSGSTGTNDNGQAAGGGPGQAGGQDAGGPAGTGYAGLPTDGQLGIGGTGGTSGTSNMGGAGGSGGGGLYGGGGGGAGQYAVSGISPYSGGGGGGGGGSSGVPNGAVGVSGFGTEPTSADSQPLITFTWTLPPPAAVATAATAVTSTTATLNGTVNPDGSPVSDCHFNVAPAPAGGATFPCAQQVGAGSTPIAMSAALNGLAPATSYTITLAATSAQGTVISAPLTFRSAQLSGPSAPPAPPKITNPAPDVTNVSESAKTWRETNRLAQITRERKPPIGTRFSLELSESATVSFAITQPAAGREVKGKCVTEATHSKHSPRYKLTSGTFEFTGHAGTNTVTFYGLLSKHHELKLGKYTLMIIATATGKTSKPQTLTFTIVK